MSAQPAAMNGTGINTAQVTNTRLLITAAP